MQDHIGAKKLQIVGLGSAFDLSILNFSPQAHFAEIQQRRRAVEEENRPLVKKGEAIAQRLEQLSSGNEGLRVSNLPPNRF
jgi:hypothetical protein